MANPLHTALTQLLLTLDPRERMERRRRIEATAEWWALYLVNKYGKNASRFRCRQLMALTSKTDAHLRNHIWARVYRNLK